LGLLYPQLLPFAMYVAFPRSDYYGSSAPLTKGPTPLSDG